MNTRLLTTTFLGEVLEPGIIEELLADYSSEEQEAILKKIVATISISTLAVAFESIESMHQRAAFLHAIPQLIRQEITLSDLARFRPDLPMLLTEHSTRLLLSLRSKLKKW